MRHHEKNKWCRAGTAHAGWILGVALSGMAAERQQCVLPDSLVLQEQDQQIVLTVDREKSRELELGYLVSGRNANGCWGCYCPDYGKERSGFICTRQRKRDSWLGTRMWIR